MKLRLHISPDEKEKFVAIHAPSLDEDVQQIISCIEDLDRATQIYGKYEDATYVLDIKSIISFRTYHNQVVAIKGMKHFKIKERLYELEAKLPTSFIRISKSEIVNSDKIEKLHMELNRLIRMYLKDADFTYSSRRYLKSIKERLSL